jgi:hypothetical protein
MAALIIPDAPDFAQGWMSLSACEIRYKARFFPDPRLIP